MKAAKVNKGMQVRYNQGRGHALRAKVLRVDGSRVLLADDSHRGARKRKPFWRLAEKLAPACVALLAALCLPALAFAQGPVVVDPGSDPMAFVNQILAAAHAHNWLLAVPLAALLVIWALRLFGSKVLNVAWFASDQGGAVLALLAAVAEAVVAAAVLPGPHALAATVVWVAVTLFRNRALYKLLQSAVAGTRFAGWLALIPAPVDAPAAPAVPGGTVPPAAKAAMLAILGLSMLLSSPARAQGCFGATDKIECSAGPTVSALMLRPGEAHLVSVAAGAGVQFAISLPQLDVAAGSSLMQALSLEGQAFGSLINSSNQQFGALSLAIGLCTASGLVCLSYGHDVLVSAGQKSESFALLSMGFNFGLGAATGTADAARPRRFNTIYF